MNKSRKCEVETQKLKQSINKEEQSKTQEKPRRIKKQKHTTGRHWKSREWVQVKHRWITQEVRKSKMKATQP